MRDLGVTFVLITLDHLSGCPLRRKRENKLLCGSGYVLLQVKQRMSCRSRCTVCSTHHIAMQCNAMHAVLSMSIVGPERKNFQGLDSVQVRSSFVLAAIELVYTP